jgi:flavin-dependent dehydrogenase
MQLVAPSGEAHLLEYGDALHGLSVSRLELDTTLVDIARDSGVDVREGVRVSRILTRSDRVAGVVDATGEEHTAELTVGADGLHSVVARDLHARRIRRWPRRLGLVAHFDGVDWPQEFGQLLVGRGGYVGVAPLDASGALTVGLVMPLPEGRLGPPAAALETALANKHSKLAERLRRGRLASEVRGVGPLAMRVRPVAGPGYALVGDAAGFFDPFTGEGIFRALRGAELLAGCPPRYAVKRARAFAAKERLVTIVQVIVQSPALMDFAVRRLNQRAGVARELALMLGDLAPSRLGVAWRLLGP